MLKAIYRLENEVKQMPILQAAEIQALIPNRYPICYIDAVTALEPDQFIRAVKNVTINEDFFQGYVPQMMPNTLLIETLAQAASILILKSPQFAHKTAYLGSVTKAEFLKPVVPGDVLTLEITLTKVRQNMGVVHTQALVAGEMICQAELHFVVDAVD
jgi:3-hydroxyacyl-[acyl-carrier-protein] dehydratase